MKRHPFLTILLCCVFCTVLLSACGKQPAEDPALTQPTTASTQGSPEEGAQTGGTPVIPNPQQTQPVTEATGTTAPDLEPNPTEGAKPTEPPKATQPTEVAEPSKPTQPTETTEPTQPTEATEPTQPPELEEDELPLVPLF